MKVGRGMGRERGAEKLLISLSVLGRDLLTHDPYVKMYMSEKGNNIRATKLKTRVVVRRKE
jgi:hypothetical protein